MTKDQRAAPPLRQSVEQAVDRYFDDLDGEPGRNLHQLVMHEVEAPLIAAVLRHTNHNVSRAAAVLGLARGTLRKKIQHHGL